MGTTRPRRRAAVAHEAVALDQIFTMRSKRLLVADIERQPELKSHTMVTSRLETCCLQGHRQALSVDAQHTTVVLSKTASSQPSDSAAIRQGMYDLFLKDFGPLRRFATAHGTEIDMLRCMVDGAAPAEFPAWQSTIQLAVCDEARCVIAAALVIPVNAALAWMPILSVQPHTRGQGIGRTFVRQITDVLSSCLIESLLIPSSNEPKLIKWWSEQTKAKRMNDDQVDILVDSFPCLCEIDKTKMLVARLLPDHESSAQKTIDCEEVMRNRAAKAADRSSDYCGMLAWQKQGKRLRSDMEGPT
eukprot:jgi/Ulvmu1/10007/UM059_0056.1